MNLKMKKLLFISAATLALILSSCGGNKDKTQEPAAEPQATETPAQPATCTQAVVNEVFESLKKSVADLKTKAESAKVTDVLAITSEIKTFKENYDKVKSQISADQQGTIEASVNEVIEILKTKN